MQLRQPTMVFSSGQVLAFIGKDLVGKLIFDQKGKRAVVVEWEISDDQDLAPIEAAMAAAVTDELKLQLVPAAEVA